MRKLYYTFFTLCALLFTTNTVQAQLFEDFEDGSKASYAAASVDLSTGSWYLDDALIGSETNDRKNGSKSVRLRNEMYMQFNSANGADVFSFYGANAGFSNDTGGKVQVYYSTDNGSTWTAVGDEITLTESDALELYSVPVEVSEPIRFKIEKTTGNRVNIDDVRVTEFIIPEDEATLDVFVDGEKVEHADSAFFSSTLAGQQREKTVQLKNRGNETLNITEATLTSDVFSITGFNPATLAFNESMEFTVVFSPASEGLYESVLEISSNAANAPNFALNVSGTGMEDGDIIPISEARELPLGSRVTVAGRVTVANQFDGPVSFQDATAGLSAYWPALHTEVSIGDSIVISGPLTEFNPIAGPDGDFMLQIGAHEDDDDITFEVFSDNPKIIEPKLITAQQMNAGGFESQLVMIENVAFSQSGVFEGETNVEFNDGTADGLMRIDGDAEDIVGAAIPEETINVIGVVDQFAGDYQLKPRFVDDLGVEEVILPGEDVTMDQTLDVVTWNIEWFGSAGNEPDDDELQLQNVKTVIDSINADLYAFQEIANPAMFGELVASLEGYGGFVASFSQSQKTAFLFNRATIDSLDSGLINDGFTTSMWAGGRFPLMFHFSADINGEQQDFYAYTIHAKAFDDESSYNQRYNASLEMKEYLDNNRAVDNVLYLGDFNDTMTGSISAGKESPYKNFVDDTSYVVVTKNLEEKGYRSQSIGSFIDHIIFTTELSDEYFEGTERVENTNYIGSYLSTTSDHYPVWTRFKFGEIVYNSNEIAELPKGYRLDQNYPNPFNPTTVIGYELPSAGNVKLEVFDMLGQKVATLVDGNQSAGYHTIDFKASAYSSGVYIYRLTTGSGVQMTKKMLLLK